MLVLMQNASIPYMPSFWFKHFSFLSMIFCDRLSEKNGGLTIRLGADRLKKKGSATI